MAVSGRIHDPLEISEQEKKKSVSKKGGWTQRVLFARGRNTYSIF